MIARHVVAERAFQMFDQGRHARGGFLAIERRTHYPMMLARTVFPSHRVVRVGLAPPIGRVATETWQEEGARVGVQDLRADVVHSLPVRGFSRLGPGHVYGKADEIHSGSRRHTDLGFKRAGRAAQIDEGVARSIEGHGEVARGLGADPEADAVMFPAGDG